MQALDHQRTCKRDTEAANGRPSVAPSWVIGEPLKHFSGFVPEAAV
jgi:hypothetical protein